MSNRTFRKVLAAAAVIAWLLPVFASSQASSGEMLHRLEKRLKKNPKAVLETLDRLEPDLQGQVRLLRRSRFLRSQALFQLGRYADAEKTLENLLSELTADADSDPLLVSRTALGLGTALSHQSRPSESEAALNLALRQLPPEAPPEIRGQILLAMTRVMIYLGEPVSAADRATESLEWASTHSLDTIALQARYLLGYAYRNQDDAAAARPHFERVREDARRLGNLRYEILSMNELGNLLVMEKQLDAAMEIKQEALARSRKAGDDYLISVCLHDIGYALIARKEYARALELYRAILQRETTLNNPRTINMTRINIAYIYSEMGRWNEARRMAEQTLNSVREHQLGELEPDLLAQIVDLSKRQGRLDEALQRQQELTELNEKKFRRELERKLTEIRDRHRLMEQESEIRILRQDKEIRSLQLGRQRILILSMIGLAFFLLLLAVLAFLGYRTKQRANRNLENLNSRLDELSRRDTLTGLSNRRDMMEKLQILKARADRDGSPLSMLMIDMDHFKAVNDSWGHEQGDRVLQAVARILRERVRGQDLLARWGGEEFLAALADTNCDGALRAAEHFRRAVENADLAVGSPRVPVTITVGVAQYQPGEDLQAAITRADDQLYAGKRAGRNRVAG